MGIFDFITKRESIQDHRNRYALQTEVEASLQELGVDITQDNYDWIVDFCEVVCDYTHKKLEIKAVLKCLSECDNAFRKPSVLKTVPIGLRRKSYLRYLKNIIQEKFPCLEDSEWQGLAMCIYIIYGAMVNDDWADLPDVAIRHFSLRSKVNDLCQFMIANDFLPNN